MPLDLLLTMQSLQLWSSPTCPPWQICCKISHVHMGSAQDSITASSLQQQASSCDLRSLCPYAVLAHLSQHTAAWQHQRGVWHQELWEERPARRGSATLPELQLGRHRRLPHGDAQCHGSGLLPWAPSATAGGLSGTPDAGPWRNGMNVRECGSACLIQRSGLQEVSSSRQCPAGAACGLSCSCLPTGASSGTAEGLAGSPCTAPWIQCAQVALCCNTAMAACRHGL